MDQPVAPRRPFISPSRGLSSAWWRERGRIGLVLAAGVLIGLAAPSLGRRGDGAAAAGGWRPFGICAAGGGGDCVIDGDTFRIGGERVRVADIDAPETHPSRCAEEARLGEAATERLRVLLNGGPVVLAPIDRDRDRYGRLLRVVMRDGRSIGGELVDEGLARRWEGRRQPWCRAPQS